MNFTSIDQLNRFCQFIEEETGLFALDFLGYPWYKMAKDNLNNTMCVSKPSKFSDEHKEIRRNDFRSKKHLLKGKYDYLFIVKAKMRRNEDDKYENHLFIEILEYLAAKGKKILVIEEPSGKEYDVKYLHSKFADVTIPLEFIYETAKIYDNPEAKLAKLHFEKIISDLFSDLNYAGEWLPYVDLLKEKYLLYANEIPRIVYWQDIIESLGVTALFGGMGTHFFPGLNNRFAIVEVGHGFSGEFHTERPFSSQAMDYFKEHFRLEALFKLVPSPTDKLFTECGLFLEQNRFNYGMPEIRSYINSPDKIHYIIDKYGLKNNFVILIATTGWVDYDALKKLLELIVKNFPQTQILLRPHPYYDSASAAEMFTGNVIVVDKENKYDLFSIADAFISPASSMVVEANEFLGNIIVYPNKSDSPDDLDVLKRRYPCAVPISLDNARSLLDMLEYFRLHPYKKPLRARHFQADKILDGLLSRIDAIVGKNCRDNKPHNGELESMLLEGESLYSEGRLEEALAIFKLTAEKYPLSADAFNNMGVVYLEMGKSEESLLYFTKAYELNPSEADIAENYSSLLKAFQK